MTEINLPSGAVLKITESPFAIAKALYQACLVELKTLKMDANADIDVNLIKDLFCAGFSSPAIDKALSECLKRCTYNGVKITEETFEPLDARADYVQVLWEVALANLLPFTSSLTQQLGRIKVMLGPSLPSK